MTPNNNIKVSLLLLITFFCSNPNIYAQESEIVQPEEKHLITFAMGYSYIPEGGEEGDTEAKGLLSLLLV